MTISTQQESDFIRDYTKIMMQIYEQFAEQPETKLLEKFVKARPKYCADRSLLDSALQVFDAQSITILAEVISAVRSLEVKKCVYLKDTRSYSVFIDPSAKIAYGVLGLTERLRNIIGGTGAFVETGLLRYNGKYSSDGIINQVIWLGKNLKEEFTDILSDLKRQGLYYRQF